MTDKDFILGRRTLFSHIIPAIHGIYELDFTDGEWRFIYRLTFTKKYEGFLNVGWNPMGGESGAL